MPEDHIEGLVVPGESIFESIQIGGVPNVGLVDFDEEVVVFEVAEPVDPADFDLLAEFAIVRHFLLE